MKALVALTLCLFSLAFVPQEKIKLEIGAKLSRKYIPKKVTEQIAIHTSQRKTLGKLIYESAT